MRNRTEREIKYEICFGITYSIGIYKTAD